MRGRNHNLGQVHHTGFTLVEVLLAIALVVLLLLGISQVFRLSGKTVGAGQTLSAQVRDERAFQAVLADDMRNVVWNSPLFLIDSRTSLNENPQSGWLSREDQTNDSDGRVQSIDGRPGEVLVPQYGRRNHRADRLVFFAQGRYRRQTADDGAFVSATTSNEACIYLGHLALPQRDAAGNISAYAGPFEGPLDAADTGRYAADWVLGRFVAVLRDPASITEGYITAGSAVLGPLAGNSPSGASAATLLRHARYDLVGTTLDSFRQTLAGYSGSGQEMLFRFECNPYVRRPMTSAALAKAAPYFIGHASQFVVEFAGDYIAQNNNRSDPDYGKAVLAGADGRIDYIVENRGGATVERIRWYGLPRDTNGDGIILGGYAKSAHGNWPQDRTCESLVDVVPVSDLLRILEDNDTVRASFEVQVGVNNVGTQLVGGSYLNAAAGQAVDTSGQSFRYRAMWKNDSPQMLRILLRLDDPAGRLKEGHWVECVYSLR